MERGEQREQSGHTPGQTQRQNGGGGEEGCGDKGEGFCNRKQNPRTGDPFWGWTGVVVGAICYGRGEGMGGGGGWVVLWFFVDKGRGRGCLKIFGNRDMLTILFLLGCVGLRVAGWGGGGGCLLCERVDFLLLCNTHHRDLPLAFCLYNVLSYIMDTTR